MSVPSQTPYNIYTANGLTTVFAYQFYIISASDLQVSINGGIVTSGYTVAGVGNEDGGDITFLTPPANGAVVMLQRVVPAFRLTDYQDNGDLLADTVNKDFDRLWMAMQQAFLYLGLALQRPLLGGPFDAENYRISNLGNPASDHDAANKAYVDDVTAAQVDAEAAARKSADNSLQIQIASNLQRTLRVPESVVDEIPGVSSRGGKVLAFNDLGKPIAVLPQSGSASDVLIQLAASSGSNLVGWNDSTVGEILDRMVDSTAMAYDILYVFGQSNALGQAGTAGSTTEWPEIMDGNLMWDRNALTVVPTTQQLYSTGTGDNHSTGHAWGAFINEYLRLRPNRKMILMMGAIGATSIAQLSKGAGTGYYEKSVEGVENLKSYLTANNMPVGDVYGMIHHGETDMTLGTTFLNYRGQFLTLTDNLATDIGFKQLGICLVGCPSTRPSYRYDSIQLAQRSVVTLRPNVFLAFEGCGKFSTADNTMTAEGTHYTQRGYNTMGNAAARELVKIITSDGTRIQQSPIESSQLGRVLTPNYMKAIQLAAYIFPNGSDFAFRHAGNGSGQVRSAGVRSIGISSTDNTRLDIGLSVDPQYILNFELTPRAMKGIDLFTEITRVSDVLQCYLKGHVTIGIRFDTGQLYNTATVPPAVLDPTASHYLNSLFTLAKENDGSMVLTHPANIMIPMVCEFSPLGGLDVIKQGVLAVQQISTTQTRVLFKPATAGDYGAVCALVRFVDLTIPWTALLATAAPSTIEFQLNGLVGIH